MDATVLNSWLALQTIDGIGDRTLLKLVRTFGSPVAVLQAARVDLIRAGCNPKLAESVQCGPELKMCRQIERQQKVIERRKIQVLTFFDPSCPARLRVISDPPPLLYLS